MNPFFCVGRQGIDRPTTSKDSSLPIMAIVGGVVILYLLGVFADHIGPQHMFFLPLLCYLYIVSYGIPGQIRTLLQAD